MPTNGASRRPVRSYVRRSGRITAAQKKALGDHWPTFGVEYSDAPVDFDRLFGRTALRVLEIGFGNGACLIELATRFKDLDFLGVDVHEPGVGHVLMEIAKNDLPNVRLFCHDAVEVICDQIPEASLAGVNLFFPDPWPKKRHHKRRLVQEEFVRLVASKFRPGGFLHIATDWSEYGEHIRDTVNGCHHFTNVSPTGAYIERPGTRPLTHFERRGKELGLETRDLLYLRNTVEI